MYFKVFKQVSNTPLKELFSRRKDAHYFGRALKGYRLWNHFKMSSYVSKDVVYYEYTPTQLRYQELTPLTGEFKILTICRGRE